MLSNSHIARKIVQSLVLVTLTTPFLAACGGSSNEAADDTVTLVAAPAESSQSLQSGYDNLARLTAKETGKEVEFQDTSDYAAVVEGRRTGRTDIVSYDPFSYAIVHDSGVSIEAIASPTNDESKASVYTSPAYVKEGSDIELLRDPKDKKVCFVDPISTSGYLVPTRGPMDEGLEPGVDLEPVMTGDHGTSLLTLNNGGCDVAFAYDAMLKTLEKSSQIKSGTLKSIWESEPITEDPIAPNTETISTKDLAKIKTALSDKANGPALVKEGICSSEKDCTPPEGIEWSYLPTTDVDPNSIREIYETIKADACNVIP